MFFRYHNVAIDLIYNKFDLSKCLPKYRLDTICRWIPGGSFKSNKTLKAYVILAKLIYFCFAGIVFIFMARDGCAFVAAIYFLHET